MLDSLIESAELRDKPGTTTCEPAPASDQLSEPSYNSLPTAATLQSLMHGRE